MRSELNPIQIAQRDFQMELNMDLNNTKLLEASSDYKQWLASVARRGLHSHGFGRVFAFGDVGLGRARRRCPFAEITFCCSQ